MILNNIVFYLLFNLVVVFSGIFIASKALGRYYREPVNFENTFYWGISFILLSLEYLLLTITLFYEIRILIGMIVLLRCLSLWYQFSAIAFSISCSHSCVTQGRFCGNGVCKRKKVRVYTNSTLIVMLLGIMGCFYLGWNGEYNLIDGLFGVRVADLGVTLIQIILLVMLFMSLKKTVSYEVLKYSFILLLGTLIIRGINILLFGYNTNVFIGGCLMQAERGFFIVSTISILYYVYKITNDF